MAELSISPQDIKSALDQFVDSYEPSQANAQEVGYVTEAADGIAHIEGVWLTRWVTRLMVWVKSKTWWGAARWNCRPPA